MTKKIVAKVDDVLAWVVVALVCAAAVAGPLCLLSGRWLTVLLWALPGVALLGIVLARAQRQHPWPLRRNLAMGLLFGATLGPLWILLLAWFYGTSKYR